MVLDADIKGCFDSIAHGPLLEKLAPFAVCTLQRLSLCNMQLLERWLKAG